MNKTTELQLLDKLVKKRFDYLVEEGVVIQMSNGKYRLKTQKEIDQETAELLKN